MIPRRVASPSFRPPVRAGGDARRPRTQPCVALDAPDPEEDILRSHRPEETVSGEDSHEVESEEEEEEQEEEEEEENGEDALATTQATRCVPKRPQRKTAKSGRVQRFVLQGPGQAHVPARSENGKRAEVFMTHLPDSPPRIYGASGSKASRGSIFKFSSSPHPQQKSALLKEGENRERIGLSSGRKDVEEEEGEHDEEDEEETVTRMPPEAEDNEDDDDSADQRPEVDESTEDADAAINREELSSPGPHVVDINKETPAVRSSERNASVDDFLSESDSDSDLDQGRDEEEYKAMQEGRARFEAEQLERDNLRLELESYVASLSAKCDDQGEPLIEFPKNFQQIVSLMTARDIERDDNVKPVPGKPPVKHSDRHKSWSQVLIQNSLAKQQAFGPLDESEDGGDGESSMAAKIALKMARIRQLDVILEEKLGKNLYSMPAPVIKKAKKVNPQEPEVTSRSKASTREAGASYFSGPSNLNFVERNRKVVENGAKANMTRDEEQRLKKLLRGSSKQQPQVQPDDEATPQAEPATEFALEHEQKVEIEKLIAEKRGVYQSAVVMALDDIRDEELDVASDALLKRDHRKPNIVQEAKRERLRKQRLQRIEEELQFLHANTSVPILPDEDDDDASDGCMSERSYMTTTSVLSTCSTRSGVTRRQLDQFVAMELNKPECSGGSKATQDDIQNLLRSLSSASFTTNRPTTTKAG